MKIIHTSDWHIGATIGGNHRYDEQEQFLNWLSNLLIKERYDLLIVSGDIFDTVTPSNKALNLYYQFLSQIISKCKVVIIAGNHDSPSFLQAPKDLLNVLDIHVVGSITDNPADEVFVIHPDGQNLIICGVPYLRPGDIRLSEPGESDDDKNKKALLGIKTHYHNIAEYAEKIKSKYNDAIVLATGHLFAAGGITHDGDGVRDLSIGGCIGVGADAFPEIFDYVALGHLHEPQLVAGCKTRRYSGSPLASGFSDTHKKCILSIVLNPGLPIVIREIPVPVFTSLVSLNGTYEEITAEITKLVSEGKKTFVEIDFTELTSRSEKENLKLMTESKNVEIVWVKETSKEINPLKETKPLEELSELDVFMHCLDDNNIEVEKRGSLISAFKEILTSIYEEDKNAQ